MTLNECVDMFSKPYNVVILDNNKNLIVFQGNSDDIPQCLLERQMLFIECGAKENVLILTII